MTIPSRNKSMEERIWMMRSLRMRIVVLVITAGMATVTCGRAVGDVPINKPINKPINISNIHGTK